MTYYLAGPIYVTRDGGALPRRAGRLAAMDGGARRLRRRAHRAPADRPASFGWPALIAFAGSIIYALFLVVTRSLRGTPDTVMAAWQIGPRSSSASPAAWWHWTPIAAGSRRRSCSASSASWRSAAIVCVNRSLALAPASVVVPYQYTMIVWAVIFGYLVFGDVPDLLTFIGAAIIIAAGLFIFFRERKVRGEMSKDIVPGP